MERIKAWFKWLWNSHIQTVLGIGSAILGMLEYIDQQTIQLIGTFFGPKWGPTVARGIQVTCALIIAYRARQVKKQS